MITKETSQNIKEKHAKWANCDLNKALCADVINTEKREYKSNHDWFCLIWAANHQHSIKVSSKPNINTEE